MDDSAFALAPPVALDRSRATRAAAELLARVMARRYRVRDGWDGRPAATLEHSDDRAYHAFVARTRGF
jgi:hypothetical protein